MRYSLKKKKKNNNRLKVLKKKQKQEEKPKVKQTRRKFKHKNPPTPERRAQLLETLKKGREKATRTTIKIGQVKKNTVS